MTKSWTCPSCAKRRSTAFCPLCGEQRLRLDDLSVRDLAGQFARSMSSVDGKLLRSWRYVLTVPGRLTAAYVDGERRRFVTPIALFFIANALFVGMQSLTGTNVLSSPLDSHLHAQDWSNVAQSMVERRIHEQGESLAQLADKFDRAAIFNAKALIVLMVLAFAPVAALMFGAKRRAAGAHVVFALHLYAFVLVLLCASLALAELNRLLGGGGLRSPIVDLFLSLFNLSACGIYIYFAIGPVYGTEGVKRFAQAAVLAVAVGALFVGYRFAIFLITLYSI